MSKNIEQVYVANPITTNAATDLMYFGQSPYTAGNDAAMTYANFSAQFGAPYTPSALTSGNDTNITLTLGGSPTTALLHAASITAGWTGLLSPARGGTGVNNSTSTFTIGGNFQMSGAFTFNGTLTGNTAVTFPTSGTLATTSQLPTGAALTASNDTNITLSLGGTPTTALLQAASITAGWSGTLAVGRGGLGISTTPSNGQIPIGNGTNYTASTLTAGSGITVTNGAGSITIAASGSGSVNSGTANQIGYYATTGTAISGLTGANSAMLVTNSTGVPAMTASMTNGQVIIGSTGATPVPATLTAGSGVTITNGAGSITIAASGGGSTWVTVATGFQTIANNTGYVTDDGATLVTYTLPATSAVGDTIEILGKSSGGWVIVQGTGQSIRFGNITTTVGVTGTLASSNQYDCVRFVCITANTTYAVTSAVGSLTFV
jgi:hypothetical protein